MPYIEEQDLINLHKQIDRERKTNNKLLDQIKEKNKTYDRTVWIRNILWGVCIITIVCAIAGFFYFQSQLVLAEESYSSCYDKNVSLLENYKSAIASIDSLRDENLSLREGGMALDLGTVYSVQIKAFEKDRIPLRSVASNLIYSRPYNGFYAYSIGVFKTLREAQALRKELVKIGFNDAFVASYKDGKRIRIEEAE